MCLFHLNVLLKTSVATEDDCSLITQSLTCWCMQPLAANRRIKLIRTMCCDDILMPDQDRTVLCNLLWRGNEEGGGKNGRTFFQSIFAYLQCACHSCEGWGQWTADYRGWLKSSAALNASPGSLHWIRWTQTVLTARLQGHQCFCYPPRCWGWFSGVFHLYLFQGRLHTSKRAELPRECEMCVFQNTH